MTVLTKATVAHYVARIARHAAMATTDFTEGMWNPDFCSSDGSVDAVVFIEDMRRILNHFESKIPEPPK